MKKLLLCFIVAINSFSNYYLINYNNKNYRSYDSGELYLMLDVNPYKRTLVNKYTQKYKIIRRLTDEEIKKYNCSPVYDKFCK